MRRATLALIVSAACLAPAPASAEPSLTILPVGFEVSEFRGPASRVAATVASTDAFRETRPALAGPLVVLWGREGGAVLSLAGREIAIRRATRGIGDFGALERSREAIPGARVASLGAFSATLEGPSRDYPHEALGSPVHAAAIGVTERRPASIPTSEPKPVGRDTARIAAGEGAVFEDREARLADLDRDGVPEIVVVRSTRDKGSALAVIGRRGGAWTIVAETPPDGEPFRWLDPAAILPDAPGGALIAIVRRPHLDGLLQLWRFSGDRLALVAERAGYANHAFGSTAQDLAAPVDLGDGVARLALPSLDRRALSIVTLAAPIAETVRIPLPARALTGVAALGRGPDLHLLVGLEDGRIADIRP